MSELRAVIYGVGNMGRLTARLLLERGVRITGAVGHVTNVGRDLGDVIGWEQPLGVTVSADAAAVLADADADIALLAVGGHAEETYAAIAHCVEAGVNVITLQEDVFYPWHVAPDVAERLDRLAKQHHVTVTAGGIQDVFWVGAVAVLSGASQTIEAIEGTTVANAADYGPVLAEEHHLGEAPEDFPQMSPREAANPNVFTIALEALAADIGLTVTGWRQEQQPLIASSEVFSEALGRPVKPGEIIGVVLSGHVTTAEGVPLVGHMRFKLFEDGDVETSQWVIKGVPTLRLETPELPGEIATCTTMINRIPDVIAAEPGLVTVDRLAKPKYKARLLGGDQEAVR